MVKATQHFDLYREIEYERTARRLAKKLWDRGHDPATMQEMKSSLKEVGWSFDLSDQFLMRVDDALALCCGGECNLLSDRPDGKRVSTGQPLPATH